MFLGALGLSIAIHSAVFLLISLPQSPLKPPPFKRPIEVAYQGDISAPPAPAQDYTRFEKQKPELPKLGKTEQEDALFKQERELVRKDIFKKEKSEDAFFKKTVNLPNIPGEVFKTPEYKSYYQLIREKIRKLAYSNYKKLDEGEVFITFSLTHDGELIDLSINSGKSTANEYLLSIAERSVKEAAPYPSFPEKLKDNKRLSFNVIISFELK